MMAIQVTQTIVRDQRMRDQAHAIHAESRQELLNDVPPARRAHGEAGGPLPSGPGRRRQIAAIAEKVTRRAARIDRWSSARKRPRSKRQPNLEAGDRRGSRASVRLRLFQLAAFSATALSRGGFALARRRLVEQGGFRQPASCSPAGCCVGTSNDVKPQRCISAISSSSTSPVARNSPLKPWRPHSNSA